MGGFSLHSGLCWFILRMAVGILRDTWYSPFGLPNVSQAGLEAVSGGVAALLFLSVMWCGKAFHRLRVQGVKVLSLLAALLPPSVALMS
jgi:hypothetical protein